MVEGRQEGDLGYCPKHAELTDSLLCYMWQHSEGLANKSSHHLYQYPTIMSPIFRRLLPLVELNEVQESVVEEPPPAAAPKHKITVATKRSWEPEYPWLAVPLDYGPMAKCTCTECVENKTGGVFTSGFEYWKLTLKDLKAHQAIHDVRDERLKNSAPAAETMTKVASEAGKNERDALEFMGHIAYGLMKQPTAPLCLLETMGQTLENAARVYDVDNKFSEQVGWKNPTGWVAAFAEVLRKEQDERLATVKVLAACLDESTDVAMREKMVIGVRYVDEMKCQGVTEFLELVDAGDTTSEGLKKVLNKVLLARSIKEKMHALTTDGASNVLGCRAGLQALLREELPALLNYHCCNHKLALAVKAAWVRPLCVVLDHMCAAMYNHGAHSALRHEALKEASIEFYELRSETDGKSFGSILKIVATRWLSRGEVSD